MAPNTSKRVVFVFVVVFCWGRKLHFELVHYSRRHSERLLSAIEKKKQIQSFLIHPTIRIWKDDADERRNCSKVKLASGLSHTDVRKLVL